MLEKMALHKCKYIRRTYFIGCPLLLGEFQSRSDLQVVVMLESQLPFQLARSALCLIQALLCIAALVCVFQ